MKVYVDGSSNIKGSDVGLIIENSHGLAIEYTLTFSFLTSNNQVEYDVCIAHLTLAMELGANEVLIHSDSQLVVFQINDVYQTQEILL